MKRAMVTGASEGIGREFALQLARQGFAITAVARNQGRLESLIAELSGQGHMALSCDLSDTVGVSKACAALNEEHHDLLINNAGIGLFGKFGDAPYSDVEKILKVNLEALVRLSHSYLQTAKRGDAIINLSSTLAFLPAPWAGVYSATKAFVTAFSESLWQQYQADGIFVMDLCPGATKSKFHERAAGSMQRQVPEAIAQTSDEVVQYALRKLSERREPTVISGRKNQAFALITRLLPRKRVVQIMAKVD